jgi:hypothetical protein
MWVRVATFEGGDTEELRRLNEERMGSGQMDLPDGVRKVVLLVDGDNNRRRFITHFDTREAIEAAEAFFDRMGDDIPESIRGRRIDVEYYEVVFEQSL